MQILNPDAKLDLISALCKAFIELSEADGVRFGEDIEPSIWRYTVYDLGHTSTKHGFRCIGQQNA